ncbi:MAG TPA: hypothetical protein VFF06_16430 [Polyangia bacterium]|nr:hypothetical protein [Polyangia bacterium]
MKTALCALVLAAGCGSSNPTFTDDAGNTLDLSQNMSLPDLSQPPSDLAGAFVCGSQGVCMGGTVCCVSAGAGGQPSGVCQASCGDAGVPVSCRGPDNCGGDPCCVTIANNVPQSVACTSAPTACPTMYTFSGSMISSGQTRLCHTNNDCTSGLSNTQYPDCCTAMMGGVTQQFCFSAGLASLSGGKVTCP